jgi:hypothetical protein
MQMSINRSLRFGEYFQIWPGAGENEVEVRSVETSLLQPGAAGEGAEAPLRRSDPERVAGQP